MPLISKSLKLEGWLDVATQRYRRWLTLHRGGPRGELQLRIRMAGKAPGGFTPQLMQVAPYDFIRWLVDTLRWASQVKGWEKYVEKEDLKLAQEVMDQWDSTGSEEA